MRIFLRFIFYICILAFCVTTNATQLSQAEDNNLTTILLTCKAKLPIIKNSIFDGNGGVNKSNIRNSNLPVVGGSLPGAINPEASSLASAFDFCISAIAQAKHPGKSISKEIIDELRKMYQPNFTDSPDEVYQKYFMLKLMVNGFLFKLISEIDVSSEFGNIKEDYEISRMQAVIMNYKRVWLPKILAAPENKSEAVTEDDASKFFNKKALEDPNFVKGIWYRMQNNPEYKE